MKQAKTITKKIFYFIFIDMYVSNCLGEMVCQHTHSPHNLQPNEPLFSNYQMSNT